jgi:hypothetical protein
MEHLEGNGIPVLYRGRRVFKVKEATLSHVLPVYPCPANEHLGYKVFYTNFNGQLNILQ